MSLAPPPSAASNNLVAEALARAQALAKAGGKRPGDQIEEPNAKKPLNMMQQDGAITEQIYVPDNMVGLLIGRGGENITRMQQESQCKIQMAPDSQGQPTRLCTLTGLPHAVQAAKDQINAVIANDGRGAMKGGGGGGPGGMMGGGGGGGAFEMMLEGPLVARVIGKGGENIKRLQEETGAKIVIIQDSKEVADQKPLRISGPPDKIEYAKQRVLQVIEEERAKLGMGGGPGMGRGRGGFRGRGGPGGPGGFRGGGRGGPGGGRGGAGWPGGNNAPGGGGGGYEIQENFSVPSNKVGLVMGKGGETIKQICQQSGAHCQVDKNAPDTAKEKNILIKGTLDAVEQAKRMIADKVGGGYGGGGGNSYNGNSYHGSDNSPYGGGGGGGGYDGGPPQGGGYGGGPGGGGAPPTGAPPGGSVQVNPATGQPDYSAQWIEYYRSLGLMKEAEMIENQVRSGAGGGGGQPGAGAPVAAPVSAAAPAAPQQPDYSAQWAEYYRSIGKIAEAEAIEKNMRAKSGSVPPAGYAQPQAGYGAPQPGFQQPGYY